MVMTSDTSERSSESLQLPEVSEQTTDAAGEDTLTQVEDQDGAEPLVLEAELPGRLGRRDRKRKKLLELAAQEYGTDLVRKLGLLRDVRERIVLVAEAVLAHKGFAGARTQEIADLAGVNKAMIHYYFDSKEKLYHAVLDKVLFDLIKLTQESLRDGAPYPEQVTSFF